MSYLYRGKDWTPEILQDVYEQCEIIGKEELDLSWYPNQFEIVSYSNMLDVYSSIGMPLMYNHWSFGKSYLENYNLYKQGRMGLALEMVINSNPCVNYLMDENTVTGQALVIAHAAIGHNSFFKNNYLFKQWTAADYIIDYLQFAKNYISKCEEKYGNDAVESLLDSAHSLMRYGVDRYHKPKILTAAEENARQKSREENYEKSYDALWSLVPISKKKNSTEADKRRNEFLPNGQEENLLYFLEKKSPILQPWEREIVRIVRKISQYFSPQMQTKTINEGWASTVHYYIMNRMYDKGLIDNGSMLEFLALHTAVVRQEPFNSKYFGGFNPYHLGFSIFSDIKRICENPTDEDRDWFPEIAGSDWVETWNYAYQNFRDDSFVQQFLSPKLMREMRLFSYIDDELEEEYLIENVHNERGYRNIRKALSDQYSIGNLLPNIQVTDVDFDNRTCYLTHLTNSDILLKQDDAIATLNHFKHLWGFEVILQTRDSKNNELICEYPIDFD